MSSVLVLQHLDLASCVLPKTLRYLGISNPLCGNHLRLPVKHQFVLPNEVVAELNSQQVDFAVLPNRSFQSFGLLASDMDSTLITIECIDEIAAYAGLKDQIAAITEQAMQGSMDFSHSLHERVALLKGLPESVLFHVYENVLRLSVGAENLIGECRRYGVKTMLVSGGFTFFTERLKHRLGLDWVYANELEIENGVLTGRVVGKIIDAQAKADLLTQHRLELGLSLEQTLAVGDGANDIPMFQAAGFGMAYHAKKQAQEAADVCIHYNGLDAVRHWFA